MSMRKTGKGSLDKNRGRKRARSRTEPRDMKKREVKTSEEEVDNSQKAFWS